MLKDGQTNPKQTPHFVVKKQKSKNRQRIFSPGSFKSDKSKFTDNSKFKNSDISVNQEFSSHIKRQEVLVPLQKPILRQSRSKLIISNSHGQDGLVSPRLPQNYKNQPIVKADPFLSPLSARCANINQFTEKKQQMADF